MSLIRKVASITPVRKLMSAAAQHRAGQFMSLSPGPEQRRIFSELLTAASDTEFGRQYRFAELLELTFEEAYSRYCQAVPIRTYQDFWSEYFSPCMSQLPDGSKHLEMKDRTWPGTTELFCETSGTTAPTKFIPFSNRMFEENQRAALDLICCYIKQNPDSEILNSKILYMSGSTSLNEMQNGVFSGDMSAITLRFRPWYLEPFVEPPLEVSALPWDQKLQAMAELLLNDSEIRVLSGVPPWIILLLKRCSEISGKPVNQALPHLELIIHGGTSIKPYLAEFHQLFNSEIPNLIELLPSSEAFMGFQCAGDQSMRLTPFYGVFFEFVRFEELGENGRPDSFSNAVPLEKVETGQRYAIILSTCSGLWRYHIGDTIRFTSLSPHFIEFTGRDRFLDKLEEKVTQEEVELAVASLNNAFDFGVSEFMVGTDVPNRRHIWVLAGEKMAGADTNLMATLLDGQLKEMNADYATFREQGRIGAPHLLAVNGEMIYNWSKDVRGKLGGQSKIPHIDPTADSSMISSIREYIESDRLSSGRLTC
jgi:hypothetical protein